MKSKCLKTPAVFLTLLVPLRGFAPPTNTRVNAFTYLLSTTGTQGRAPNFGSKHCCRNAWKSQNKNRYKSHFPQIMPVLGQSMTWMTLPPRFYPSRSPNPHCPPHPLKDPTFLSFEVFLLFTSVVFFFIILCVLLGLSYS